MDEKPPPIDADLTFEMVRVAHTDADRVRELLASEPRLVNATWDWGGGDFETALGAASHMGRADIAEVLLAAGARMDVFCAAMLGHVDVVRAALDADPRTLRTLGPHGITLVQHAEAGGQDAVVALLNERLTAA